MSDIHIGYEHSFTSTDDEEIRPWHETIFRLEAINPFYQALFRNNRDEAEQHLIDGAHPLIGDSCYSSEMIGDRIFFDKGLVEMILSKTSNKQGLIEYIDWGIKLYNAALCRLDDKECIPVYAYQDDEKFKFNLIGLFTFDDIMRFYKMFIHQSIQIQINDIIQMQNCIV